MSGETRMGEAGRRGADVRSDCWVSAKLQDEGGIQLALTSKVEALFGASLREDILAGVEALGIPHVVLEVEDMGALPWVVQARVEAALLRAGAEPTGDARPEGRPPPRPGGTPRDYLRRSRLYLPGNEPKFALNAGLHRPDGVILDLEDSVHASEKDAARLVVRNALRCVDFGKAERMVRINQGPLGLEDLDAVVPEGPEVILIPKAETADQILAVQSRIEEVQETQALDQTIWLMPILESALGVENAFAIASAHDAVVAITIGLEDYTADMGTVKTPEGSESEWARFRVVNAAKAAGIQASDSVYSDVADEEGLLATGKRSRSIGFDGMGCIHPRQIRVIHEAYAPNPAELEKAQRIVAAFEEAEKLGLGVVSLGSKMIDKPVVLRALKLVAEARKAGLIGEEAEDE
jgi:citrate lyase subunit beta/citryl-CoA lyase